MKPTVLGDTRLEMAAGVLARAFQEDAGTAYLFPDPTERAVALPAFFTVMTRFALAHGEVYAWDAPALAVALWLPHWGRADRGRNGRGRTRTGRRRVERRGRCPVRQPGRLSGSDPRRANGHQPDWTLFFVGVEPARQGRGAGSALLCPMLERIAAAGLPGYTERLEARNVPFYERLGFGVGERSTAPNSSVPVWSLRFG